MRILISRPRVWAWFFVAAIVGALAIIAIRVSEAPLYGQFTPAYDVSGVWTSKDPGPSVWYQNGIEVRNIYVVVYPVDSGNPYKWCFYNS
jgi:hypothetical protein